MFILIKATLEQNKNAHWSKIHNSELFMNQEGHLINIMLQEPLEKLKCVKIYVCKQCASH